MSKKPNKARQHKRRAKEQKSFRPGSQASAVELRRAFTSAWKAGSWAEALSCYRRLRARSGSRRQEQLEAELLFRAASDFYARGKLRVALEYLEEASALDPLTRRRYPYCAGICLARLGEITEAQSRFSQADDEFHRELLSYGGQRGEALPLAVPGDPVFEPTLLLRFWKRLRSGEGAEGPSAALRKILAAYRELVAGGDPTAPLRQLEANPGCQGLALHLRLLTAVAERSRLKVRNLLKAHGSRFASPGPEGEELWSLLELHLKLLLEENEAAEVAVLTELLSRAGFLRASLSQILSEARFRLSLGEIERGDLEGALAQLASVEVITPAVLHNRALLLQRMGRFTQANEYWMRLLKGEKKPRRSDPQEARQGYAATLKFIAQNYRSEGKLREAYTVLKEARALEAGDREALESLQQVASALELRREACDHARTLYEMDPDNEEYLYTYLDELMSLPDPDGAARLYREALQKYPDSAAYRSGLAFCYLQQAWVLRTSDQAASMRLAEAAQKLDGSLPQLAYLQGLWLKRAGKDVEAERKFRQVMKAVDGHAAELALGFGFYRDGMPERAVPYFESLCSCSCPTSDDLAEQILISLLDEGDRGLAEWVCELMLQKKGFPLNAVVDILLEHGYPELALDYSSRLIGQEAADEEDRFLHLLVLNGLGERDRTLEYARSLREDARQRGAVTDVDFYNSLIREIRSRGRFKPYYEG